MTVSRREQPPRAVRLIRQRLAEVMATADPMVEGHTIGEAVGVYAYYDFDGEPIYVGQTSSSFRDRVSRHLTGQRSDAVAKFILDPFEVADVELWSVPAVAAARSSVDPDKPASASEKKRILNPYEYTAYQKLRDESAFHAVLNEGAIHPTELLELPTSVRQRIIPDELWEDRVHADTRIARRASTIARLSQMISEREVSGGMRRTLLLQAQRIQWLAANRVQQLGAQVPDVDVDDEDEDEAIADN